MQDNIKMFLKPVCKHQAKWVQLNGKTLQVFKVSLALTPLCSAFLRARSRGSKNSINEFLSCLVWFTSLQPCCPLTFENIFTTFAHRKLLYKKYIHCSMHLFYEVQLDNGQRRWKIWKFVGVGVGGSIYGNTGCEVIKGGIQIFWFLAKNQHSTYTTEIIEFWELE